MVAVEVQVQELIVSNTRVAHVEASRHIALSVVLLHTAVSVGEVGRVDVHAAVVGCVEVLSVVVLNVLVRIEVEVVRFGFNIR